MTNIAFSLKAIGLGDRNTAGSARPVHPGDISVPLLAMQCDTANLESEASLTGFVHADAERALERALRRCTAVRSSTTLAALAQAYAALDEAAAAIDSARDAIELSKSTDPIQGEIWLDPSAVRISVEILLRFHDGQHAYRALAHAPANDSLCLSFAAAAIAVGKRDEAEKVLASYDNWAVDAYCGYLHVHFGEYDAAVPRLQRALRSEPDDVDSVFNLAIARQNLGAVTEAIATASRATQIAPGRKDILHFYLELLLASGNINHLIYELSQLRERKVVVDASLTEIHACATYLQRDLRQAVHLFTSTAELAKHEGNCALERRSRSALARIEPLI